MPPHTVLLIWGLGALLVLVVMFFILRAERRSYVRSGRQGGWLAVRLATLPVAALAVAIPLGVSRQISGMEALAWFYILLFTAAPLVYFGLHVLVARLAGLSAGQGMALAAVGLAILLLPAFAAVPLQQIGWSAQLAWSGFEAERAPDTPAAHTLAGAQRLVLPGGEEVWMQHWRADARVSAIELLEVPPYGKSGAPGRQPFTSFGTWICRDRQDLHVTWPAAMGGVAMTLGWRDASGRLQRSTLRIAPPAGEPAPIAAQWTAEGVSLPVRPPRIAAVTAMPRTDGKVEYHRFLNSWEPHESPQDFCLPRPYRAGYPLAGIALLIQRAGGGNSLRAEFPRPAD